MGLHRGGCVGLGLEGGVGIWDRRNHISKGPEVGGHIGLLGDVGWSFPGRGEWGVRGWREAGLGGALVVIAAHVVGLGRNIPSFPRSLSSYPAPFTYMYQSRLADQGGAWLGCGAGGGGHQLGQRYPRAALSHSDLPWI